MHTRPGPRRLAVVAVLAAMLAGCSFSIGGGVLDAAVLEDEISSGITEQTGQAIDAVDCPDDVPLEQGNTFSCSVTGADGSTAEATVTQVDDEGNVNWELGG